MTRIRNIFLFSASLILGLGALLTLLQHVGLFEVSSIPINVVFENSNLKSARAMSDVGPFGLTNRIQRQLTGYEHRRIWNIDLSQIQKSVMADEWVRDVRIARTFPSGIKIEVVEKEPVVAILSDRKNEHGSVLIPVTQEASLLSALPMSEMLDVPVARGDVFLRDSHRRQEMIDFMSHLPKQGFLNRANVSEIAWNSENGYSMTLIQPAVQVVLGEDSLNTKVERVAQVLNYLSAEQIKGRVIDASFSKKVLVRLRKGP